MKRIVLTGGGTAGHVTPNIALIPQLQKEGWDIHYIGSLGGMEKELIEVLDIPYHGISSGKFRRYKNFKNYSQNFVDIFKVLNGINQASKLISSLRPNIVFSKGGFVAVPVVLGAKANRVPIIVHESDMTPGLANRIAIPFAKAVCTTFPETAENLSSKAIYTGTPIRTEIFKGNRITGIKLCNFDLNRPVVMVMGGSQGAVKINRCIREALNNILKDFQVVHLCGKGNIDKSLTGIQGYSQFEYVSNQLPHIFACADIIVARAGSNSISEFLALKKPSLLIPLNAKASRGDQILNATSFEKQGFSKMLSEDKMNSESIVNEILDLYENRQKYVDAMSRENQIDAVTKIIELIRKYSKS